MKIKHNKNFIVMDDNGEYQNTNIGVDTERKYKPDTPFDRNAASYVQMCLCLAVDAAIFINLFSLISFDSPILLAVEVCGLLFSFDVLPVYLGIQVVRLKQGIIKDKVMIWLAVFVIAAGLALNVVLRITTMDLLIPDTSATSYFGTVETEAASTEKGANDIALALTVLYCVLPFLTTIGNFFITYTTYNPLKIRLQTVEEDMLETEDEIRRLTAIMEELKRYIAMKDQLALDDDEKYESMIKLHKAMAARYCDYVRMRLIERLGDPTTTSAVSVDSCLMMLERLDNKLVALDGNAA